MAKEKRELQSCDSSSPCNGLPSQDIHVNHDRTFDESAKEALEALFAKEEQTYEDFVNSFVYLNKDNIVCMSNPKTSYSCQNSCPSNCDKNDCASVSQQLGYPTSNNIVNGVKSVGIENGELLQEDIGPGMSSTLLPPNELIHRRVCIQLDNFVDDESLENDTPSCYHPSMYEDESHEESNIETQSCHRHAVGTPSEVNLPGEVHDYCVPNDIQVHSRFLDIKTQKTNSDVVIPSEKEQKQLTVNHQETESCEVEKFQLDEDFDYDNIRVTAKFDFLLKHM